MRTAPASGSKIQTEPEKISLAIDLFSRSAKSLNSSPSAFRRLAGQSPAQTMQNFQVYYTPLTEAIQWFPDSRHLVKINGGIHIVEYDNANDTVVYSGPYLENFVFPWPNGSKLVMLTNFNQTTETPANLYAIGLK